ncbi:MAG: TIGR00269 family protein [Nitrososphaerales archaeon]
MPLKCAKCGKEKAELSIADGRVRLCEICFIDYYEKKVKETVEKYDMFKPDESLGIAVSGGKDSSSLLYCLRKIFPKLDITAIHINLGIKNYSDHCEMKVKELTDRLDVKLIIKRVEDQGFSIDGFKNTIYRRKICSPCGIIKRHLIDEMAIKAGVKVLATGHNLDDTVGTMLSAFFSEDFTQLVRLKPVLYPHHPLQTKKVKPLLRMTELEDYLYALYSELPIRNQSCPHSIGTQSRETKKLLERLSEGKPGFRYQVLNLFLKKLIPMIEDKLKQPDLTICKSCGFPSSSEVCAYCRRVSLVKSVIN